MKKLLIDLFTGFVKVTGYVPYLLLMRAKIYLGAGAERKIKGAAVVISNHTSVYDFALYLFVFPFRTIRFLMADVLFRNPFLIFFLNAVGGIKISRESHSLAWIDKCRRILEKGGVIGIFPEGRLPLPGEEKPLPFKEGAAALALSTGVPVIPVVTDGRYFSACPAHVLIGKPIDVSALVNDNMSEQESIKAVNLFFREEIIRLEAELEERTKQN